MHSMFKLHLIISQYSTLLLIVTTLFMLTETLSVAGKQAQAQGKEKTLQIGIANCHKKC